MIPQAIHNIIASCVTPQQLDTCRHWADYLWSGQPENRVAAEAAINQKQAQLDREEGHRTEAELKRAALLTAHTMD